ncbi:MAG: hypothetical protein WC449_04825 [Candidatus Paceibacterota bacterium]
MDFNIGPIGVAALTMAITQGVKEIFGIDGKKNQLVAVIVGIVLTSLSYGISNQLIPAVAVPYIEWAVVALGGGLSAIGLFGLFTKETVKALKKLSE